jgi:hypothetical protein
MKREKKSENEQGNNKRICVDLLEKRKCIQFLILDNVCADVKNQKHYARIKPMHLFRYHMYSDSWQGTSSLLS